MKHLFALKVEDPKTFNIGKYNPTCKAIIKAMYKMNRSATGDQILEYAVENKIWSTNQKPDKYHTTWAYYWHKVFKYEDVIVKVGEVEGSNVEEFLEE